MPGVDWIPGVSHLKAGLQLVTGDTEGAGRTMENFLKECPVVSQVTSVVQVIAGDVEGAKETQLRCLGTVNNVANGIPGVGHGKAAVHFVCGDKKGAKEAFNAATRSTVVIGTGAATAIATGGIGAIPAGIAAGLSYDAAATVITDEEQGSIAAFKNAIENPSAGAIFDACAIPVGDGVAGYSGGRLVSKRVTLNNLEALRDAKLAEMEILGEQPGMGGAHLEMGQEINGLTSQIHAIKEGTPVFWEDVKNGETTPSPGSSTSAHAFTPTCGYTNENSAEGEEALGGFARSVVIGMEDALYHDSYVDATVTRDNKREKKWRLQELAAKALLKKISDAYRGVTFTTLDILKELLERLNRNNKEPNRDPNQNPNNSRECQGQLMRYSWLLVNMPSAFSYTGIVQLNSTVHGLYHSFIRHIDEWRDVTPIDGTLIQRLSPLMREITALSAAQNDSDTDVRRREFVAARQALRLSSLRQYDDVQAALVEIQMTMHQYIQRNVTIDNFLGRSVNANGHEQLLFKVKNRQGKDVVMCVGMSDDKFLPEESNGRPLRMIVTVFFMSWEKFLRRGVVETKEEMLKKKHK